MTEFTKNKMATTEKSTAFRQFTFCSLCKLSHKFGKKHVYSKRHQQLLKTILRKFSDKIRKAKSNLFSPVAQDGEFERDAKFWCYFCTQQYLKHDIMESLTVVGAGLLEHIASKDHKANMEQFFWDNLLKKDLKAQYILSEEDLYIFKKAAFLAVKKRQKSEETTRKKMAERISYLERKRLGKQGAFEPSHKKTNIVHLAPVQSQMSVLICSDSAVTSTSLQDLPGNSRDGTSLAGSDVIRQENRYQSAAGRKKTVSARADGLTVVKQETSLEAEEGNVHSGGVPPWLQPDTDTSQSSVIGPTLQDFQKHLEKEKKAKLPANRVGANFDHTASTSHDWLPSFGRVWSKGRRLQSKQHFERQEGFGKFKQKSKTVSSTVTSSSETTQNEQYIGHYNLNSNSDNQNTAIQKPANHNSYNIEGNRFDANSATHFETPVSCIPYKRKRDVSQSVNQPSSISLPINPNWSNQGVNTVCMPYKRHRTNTDRGSDNQMKLIQTPVLSMNELNK